MCRFIDMRTLKVIILAFSFTSLTASAAIINHVDFPEAFVQAKEKAVQADSGEVTVSASTSK